MNKKPSQDEMHHYGYLWDGMIPVDQQTAEIIFVSRAKTVYCLYPDNTEAEVISLEEIQKKSKKGLMFGIEDSQYKNLHHKQKHTEGEKHDPDSPKSY